MHRRRRLCAWSKNTQSKIGHGAGQGPALRQVVLHCHVFVPRIGTGHPYAPYQLLYRHFVDKVVQPHPIGVLKLEFVVVGQQSKKDKRLTGASRGIRFVNILPLSDA